MVCKTLCQEIKTCSCCAGDELGTVLVENATAAADVLAWHSHVGQHSHSHKPLRIWDLQRLQAYDKLRQQKQAQANLAPGAAFVGHVLMCLVSC